MSKKKFTFHSEQPVRLPDGRITKISFILHPGAIIVAPFLDKNTVLMIRQYRPAIQRYIYELPAGTIDPPEKPLTCAKRELREETGFRARRFKKLGAIYPVPGYSTEVIYIFKAEGLIKGKASPEEYEVINLKPTCRREIKNLFQHGQLMDAKSICTFVHLGWL